MHNLVKHLFCPFIESRLEHVQILKGTSKIKAELQGTKIWYACFQGMAVIQPVQSEYLKACSGAFISLAASMHTGGHSATEFIKQSY